jgi:hypothetical protein
MGGILMIQGGTFCQQFQVDFFKTANNDKPDVGCCLCGAGISKLDPEIIDRMLPSKIASLENLSFIPKDKNPISQTNCYLCVMATQMMIARYSSALINDKDVDIKCRFIMTVNDGEAFQYDNEKMPNCPFCLDFEKMNT